MRLGLLAAFFSAILSPLSLCMNAETHELVFHFAEHQCAHAASPAVRDCGAEMPCCEGGHCIDAQVSDSLRPTPVHLLALACGAERSMELDTYALALSLPVRSALGRSHAPPVLQLLI